MTDFTGFPKISRFAREVIVTEKIDGTNAQIFIGDDGEFLVGSRTRWITPESDNHGFARWAYDHKDELMKLGPGRHFGEWWGKGIQRGYGIDEKRFSLFNVIRWHWYGEEALPIPCGDPRVEKFQEELPECVGLVPILWRGNLENFKARSILNDLKESGSFAAPGFMKPEGIVIFHTAGNVGFKMTIEHDDLPKTLVKE